MSLRRAALMLVPLLLLAALAGCGSGSKPKPSSTTSKPKSSPAGRPSAGPPVAFGQKTTLGGTVEATTLSYKQPSVPTGGPAAGPSGYTWGSADVQVCTLTSAKSRVNVNWKAWSLRYEDNSVVPASDKNDDAFPRPQYPFADHVVAPGQCVRGWITFAVPADQQPIAVEYAPQGFLASWKVTPSASPSSS